MTTLTLKFTLPLPPNQGNARGHRMAQHRRGKEYKTAAKATLQAQLRQQGQLPGFASVFMHAVVTAEMWVPDRYDDDNITNLLKHPLDSLKWAGIIHDDKRPWCRLAGIPEQHVIKIRKRQGEPPGDLYRRKMQANYRVELTVEEAN